MLTMSGIRHPDTKLFINPMYLASVWVLELVLRVIPAYDTITI